MLGDSHDSQTAQQFGARGLREALEAQHNALTTSRSKVDALDASIESIAQITEQLKRLSQRIAPKEAMDQPGSGGELKGTHSLKEILDHGSDRINAHTQECMELIGKIEQDLFA